jgi:Abnormal spindle-like microcephaly-assoc'd, ASPM-SPD-2-Hydin
MNRTRLVCRFLAMVFLGAAFFAMPVKADIGVSPNSVNFGVVAVNSKSHATTIVVTNQGWRSVWIHAISSSLPEFIVIGPAMPLQLGPNGNASIQVVFLPDAARAFSGSIVFSFGHKGSESQTMAVSGTGIANTAAPAPTPTYLLSPSTNSLNLGKTLVGTSASQTVALTNIGTGSVNVSQAGVTGTGFTLSGFPGPTSLAAGQSLTLTVGFAPGSVGSASGSLSVVSNATNSPATISLAGTGVQPMMSVTPTSANFGKVTVGVTNTQLFTVSNPGTANLSINQASLAGTGFSLSGMAAPMSVPPGGTSAFTVGFTPNAASNFSGNLTLMNNSPNSPSVVSLSGSGASSVLQITPTPASLSFGNITTGTSSAQTVTLANTGNSGVSISQISESGAGFSATGFSLPVSLAAGQSTSFNVTFAPVTTGNLSGGVTVTSTATNSPLMITLSGSGSAPVSHSATLSWTPSSSSFAGFNVYRGSVSGGPYTKIDSALIPTPSYTDSSVTVGQTYYYVATEVDSAGAESAYSSEVSATIP